MPGERGGAGGAGGEGGKGEPTGRGGDGGQGGQGGAGSAAIQHPKRLVYGVAVAVVAFMLLIAIAIGGSYALTIHSVYVQRTQYLQSRVPACLLAAHVIGQENGRGKTADMAIYNATGCPAIVKTVK